MGRLTLAGIPLVSVDGLPVNSSLSLEPSPELPLIAMLLQDSQTCDRAGVMRQCFRSKGVQPCTYLKDDQWYNIDLTFRINETVSFHTCDMDEETSLKLRYLLESVHPLTCNRFITHVQPPCLSQAVIKLKIRRYLTLKATRNKCGNVDPRGASNFALLLILLAGDVERNPGPTGKYVVLMHREGNNICRVKLKEGRINKYS